MEVATSHRLASIAIHPFVVQRTHSRLWRDSSADVADTIQQVIAAMREIEQYLRSYDDTLKAKLSGSACIGGWLWNPRVGFAELIAFRDPGKASSHIRNRAENVNVVLSYYINVRDVSRENATLRQLLAACYV
jgi:hypothetical protein